MEPGVGGGGAPTLEEDELPRTNFCLLSISEYYHSLKFGMFLPPQDSQGHTKKNVIQRWKGGKGCKYN